MNKKSIYLAGAIGCYKNNPEKAKNWRTAASYKILEMAELFDRKYFEIYDPTDYYNYNNEEHKTHKEVMRYYLNIVRKQDIILVNLKDIDKSVGTCDEIMYAYLNHIPIIAFYEESDDISFVNPWKIEQIDRIETGTGAMQKAISYIIDFYDF